MPAEQSDPANPQAGQPASAESVRTCRLPVSLPAESEAARFSKYAIVGYYVPNCDDYFVQHVAILSESSRLDGVSETSVFHMGPPPVAGARTALLPKARKTITPQLVGDLVLTNDECEAVADWLARVDSDCVASSVPVLQDYTIRPHMVTSNSEEDRRRPPRFSCSGFVIEAYRDAEIELLDIESIPEVSEECLRPAYEFFFKLEKAKPTTQQELGFKGREDLGIDDSGQWDVVLPGYLFHSTARATDENPRQLSPFVPNVEHRCFPCTEVTVDQPGDTR